MTALTRQRCATHPDREAAARCPECGTFFCRECVTEHAGRVICARCLQQKVAAEEAPAPRSCRSLAPLRMAFQIALSLFLAWFFFYLLGAFLVSIPSSFHEGTIWEKSVEP